jgi:hypothetical protein
LLIVLAILKSQRMVKYVGIDRDNNLSAEITGNTGIEKVNSHANFMYGKANCQSADTRKFIQSYNRLNMLKSSLVIHVHCISQIAWSKFLIKLKYTFSNCQVTKLKTWAWIIMDNVFREYNPPCTLYRFRNRICVTIHTYPVAYKSHFPNSPSLLNFCIPLS